MDIEDLGPIVASIFENPEQYDGLQIDVGSEELSPQQMQETLANKLGRKVKFNLIPREEVPATNDSACDLIFKGSQIKC